MPGIRLDLDANDLVQRYVGGESMKQIADSLSVSVSTIQSRLDEAGIARRREGGRTGRYNVAIDAKDIARRYVAGESEKSIAESIGVCRRTIRIRLVAEGVPIRGRGAAMVQRWDSMSPAERAAFTARRGRVTRGRTQTEQHRRKIAATREKRQLGVSRVEKRAIAMLRARGLSCTPQKAVGRYNVDVAVTEPRIAVEIFGGHWHTTGRHAKRHRRRTEQLLRDGWSVVFVWVSKDYPLERGAADYVTTLAERLRGHPSIEPEQHMIRGDGERSAIGKSHLD